MALRVITAGFSLLMLTAMANAIVIRHDKSDDEYLSLGEQYSPSVAYIGGCAATLIDNGWLLTAAHCLFNKQDKLFFVRHQDQQFRIENIFVHPDFNPDNDEVHDIALVQLKDTIGNGQPAALYSERDETGKPVIFVGRGTFGNGQDGLIRDDGKQRGATNTVEEVNQQVVSFTFSAPPSASELEGISSRGDSGGPAFITTDDELYVIGVSSYQISHGYKEGNYGVGEYYTRVSSYIPWLTQTMTSAATPFIASHPAIDAVSQNNLNAFTTALSDEGLSSEILAEALFQIVMQNKTTFAKAFLDSTHDFMAVAINGYSAFEFALRQGQTDIVDVFMAHTAEHPVKHSQSSAVLPYYIAYYHNSPDIIKGVKQLLAQSADIDAVTRSGDSALIITGWSTDNLALMQLLVESGADVNRGNNNGDTPLMDAAYLGKKAQFKYLLSHGGDTTQTNKRGRTALDIAKRAKQEEIIQLLLADQH